MGKRKATIVDHSQDCLLRGNSERGKFDNGAKFTLDTRYLVLCIWYEFNF